MSTTANIAGIFIIIGGVNVLTYLCNQRNLFTRWCCRTQCTLAVTNRRLGAPPRPHTFMCWDLLDAHHLYTGLGVTWLLLAWRLLQVAYFIFTVIWQPLGPDSLASGWGGGQNWMAFFTNWTFVLFGVQAVLGTLGCMRYLSRRRRYPDLCDHVLDYDWLDKAYLIVFVTTLVSAIALTAFYWAVLFDRGSDIFTLDGLFRHGVNVGIMLVDLLLARHPLVSYHVQLPILYGTLYLIFLWCHYARTGGWVYTTLSWHRSYSPAYYAAMTVGHRQAAGGPGAAWGVSSTPRERGAGHGQAHHVIPQAPGACTVSWAPSRTGGGAFGGGVSTLV